MLRCRDVHVDTARGPLDVLVAPVPASVDVPVDGVRLSVAA